MRRVLSFSTATIVAASLVCVLAFVTVARAATDTTLAWLLASSAVATLASAIVASFAAAGLNRHLVASMATLSEGADGLTSAAQQVAAAAQSLATGASEQSTSLQDTAEASDSMTLVTQTTSEQASQAAALVQTSEELVASATGALGAMVDSVSRIAESSGKIGRIVKTIDEIAFQTNLLALNAAVEAARAGDAGLGFAVVAGEVRTLAQRSAEAAHTTTALIEESVANANAGSASVDQMMQAIAALTQNMIAVKDIVGILDSAAAQHAQGLAQITQSVKDIRQVTQQAAAAAEESAATSEEISAQAETSRTSIADVLNVLRSNGNGNGHGRVRWVNSPARPSAIASRGPGGAWPKAAPAKH